MDAVVAQALVRFGLGRRGEEALPTDPAGWLIGQLRQPDAAAPVASSAQGLQALRSDRELKPPLEERKSRAVFQADQRAALEHALVTTSPFRERLVWFWSNHFTVAARAGGVAPVAGAFVAEAIRPHVAGRFEDMLFAVMHHPAMLIYLNNAQSVGPDSPAGERSHRGLNENLARECLELHTVSPAAGYTQADVTNFAKVLTGWSVDLRANPPGFRYRSLAHEPGPQVVMGRSFPAGEEGGEAALRFLANHPETHRFLATKLVQHFVADGSPPEDVRRIEAVLRDTRGDLGAAAAALVSLESAWRPRTKLRTPQDYVVAGLRALDMVDGLNVPAMLAGLGQPFWNAPQPNGWPDRASEWAAPEAMMRRIDWAYGVAGHAAGGGPRDAAELAEASLGPLLHDDTLMAIHHAGARREAITLLLTAPEFQRR